MISVLKNKVVFVVLRDSAIVVAVCAVVGILVNAARPEGIPLIQKSEYEIFVPCPEPVGSVNQIILPEFYRTGEDTFIIDARSRIDYEEWHYPGAANIPFNYLYPVEENTLGEIVSSGAKKVIVYGDGGDPDSGEELARELAGRGIRNVYYLEGGDRLIKSEK